MTKAQDPKTRKPGSRRAKKSTRTVDPTKGRICNKCKRYRARKHFYEHPTGFNGLQPACRDCYRDIRVSYAEQRKEHRRKVYVQRKEAGECVKCGQDAISGNVFCLDCWFADKASQRAGGKQHIQAVRDLWEEQDGRCYYTGVKLIPGKTASLDHMIPRAKGGEDHPSNVKWVDLRLNAVKGDMSHEEFLAMCQAVVERFGKPKRKRGVKHKTKRRK